MHKVSLYLLNHNYGSFIEESIQSVLNQTIKDFEFIIIDDGSDDKSKEILELFLQIHQDIKIIFQDNQGLISSANKALEMSSGDYLIRLDADDTLHPNALETLVDYTKKYPGADWIFPGYYLTDENGKVRSKESRGSAPFFISKDDVEPHGACSLIKRKTLIELGGYSKNVTCRDGLDLFLKIKEREKILSVPEHLFYYRQHSQNLTKNTALVEQTESVLLKKNRLNTRE